MSSNADSSKELKFNEEQIFIKPSSSKEKGLCAIITSPHALHFDDFLAKGYAPSTHKMVIIAHGNGGHKNYCYQSILAQKLASEMGIFSIRFDFRNCGDSEANRDPSEGRTIQQDVEDIDTIVKYATSGVYRGINFAVTGIVAHSRGTAAMFTWALEQESAFNKGTLNTAAYLVPNLVNCAGRFNYSNHLKRIQSTYPNWEKDGFYEMKNVYRHGTYTDVKIPRAETISLSNVSLANLPALTNSNILSIYGEEDVHIPLEDAASFANLLGDKHQLKFVKNADHNYYGTDLTPGLDVPQNSKGKYNYNHVVADMILDYLSHANELARFYKQTKNFSTISRWKDVEGIPNFRDIGAWRISCNEYVRPNYGFRCALPSKVTAKGIETLKELNITAVFDFRSLDERQRDGVLDIEGITTYHIPVMKEKANAAPADLMVQYKNLIVSWATYKDIYRDMLQQGKSAYKFVLEFIRDHPNENFLFHCSAGKDRTGVMAMLLFLICGLDKSTIAREYELTTIGLRPLHDHMKKDFMKSIEKHGDKAKYFQDMCALGRTDWTLEKDGFENIVSSRCEAMLDTIDLFNKEFGGIRNYLSKDLGFSESDIDIIRSHLTIDRSLL